MAELTVEHGVFASETEALVLAEAAGLTAITVELRPTGQDHWHDFAATVYVIEGSVQITEVATGEQCELVPGSVLVATPGVVHRENGEPFRAVVGFDCDPSTLSRPIDKSPAELPA